jgi:hypothetical protein
LDRAFEVLETLVFELPDLEDLEEVLDLLDFCRLEARVAASDSTTEPGPEIQKIDARATRRNSNEGARLEFMRAPVSSPAGEPALSRVSAL